MSAVIGIRQILSPKEMGEWSRASDAQGWKALFTSWGMITLAFLMVGLSANPLLRLITIPLALMILGGRHLALAILMHEAAHGSLFRSKALNDFIGQWLCSYPTWQDLHRYREHHLRHHQFAGSDKDPDSNLVAPFPVTRTSLRRKFLRDLSGISGVKRIFGLLLIEFGFIEYSTSGVVKRIPAPPGGRTVLGVLKTAAGNLGGVVLVNVLLWRTLALFGAGWMYSLWFLSYLIPFSLFVRIRSMAEHACTNATGVASLDPFQNTRTTRANFLARITVAPHRVNFHLEHHLLMKVPFFRLPKLHERLRENGILKNACLAGSYREVLASCVSNSGHQ